MDFPVTFHIFGKTILAHPLFEAVGMFLGMRYYFYLKRKSTRNYRSILAAVLIGATAGALFGSKLIGNLENPYTMFENFSFQKFWSNTIVGGLAFGLLGVELAKISSS
jgi:prolipoprotein diacylglyceryltransferase